MATQLGGKTSIPTEPIHLCREPDFVLGVMRISPSGCEIALPTHIERVEPRVMQVLICLYRSAEAVVSRDDLIRYGWDGRIVGDDAINRCIAKVRHLAELAPQPSFVIETVPRIGYRLKTLHQEQEAQQKQPDSVGHINRDRRQSKIFGGVLACLVIVVSTVAFVFPPAVTPRPAPWSGDDPRMAFAVLPFDAPLDDAEVTQYASVLTDEVIVATSRFRFVSRVAPRDVVSDALRNAPADQLGQILRVGYVIRGSSIRDGQSVKTSIVMTNVLTHEQLLSDTLSEPVTVEHRLTRDTVFRLAWALTDRAIDAEKRRARAVPEAERDIRDLFSLAFGAQNSREVQQAHLAIAEQAYQMAPNDPHLIIRVANLIGYMCWHGWYQDNQAGLRRAHQLLDQILPEDQYNIDALYALAILQAAEGRYDLAEITYNKVLNLNPFWVWALNNRAVIQINLGKPEECLRQLELLPAIPSHREAADFNYTVARANFLLRNFDAAAQSYKAAIIATPRDSLNRREGGGLMLEMAAAEAERGNLDGARRALTDFYATNPKLRTISSLPEDYLRKNIPGFQAMLIGGLRAAGMPE